MAERKIYPSLDIAKFVMAMLILTQHTSNEWAHSTGLVHAFFGLGNFAVPFFFACSGFLFFSKFKTLDNKGQKDYYKKWSIRIGKMYLVWTLIYNTFVLYHYWRNNFPTDEILYDIHRAIVYSTYSTIWFLPALWVGVSICYWMKRHCSGLVTFIVMAVLLLIGNTFGSYGTLVCNQSDAVRSMYDWYMDVFVTWRNGAFNGAPFVALGMLMVYRPELKLKQWMNVAMTGLFCGLFVIEAFLIVRYHFSSATDQGFMMLPATYFMMVTLVGWNVKPRPIWQHCRNLSMLIFLGQRLFLSAIPGVLPASVSESIKAWPEPCIFLFFVVLVLSFSIAVVRLSDKYKFLKILW